MRPVGSGRRRVTSTVLLLAILPMLAACDGGSDASSGHRLVAGHHRPSHGHATRRTSSDPGPALADPAASWPVIDGPDFSTHMIGVPRRAVLHRGTEAQVTQFSAEVFGESGDSVLAFDEGDAGVSPRTTLSRVVAHERGRFLAERDLTFDGYPVVAAEVAITGRDARHDWIYYVGAAPRRIELIYFDAAPYRFKAPPELAGMVKYLQLHNA